MASITISRAPSLGHLLSCVSAMFAVASALDINICSDFNTASMQRNISIFQTNGLCHDFCLQDYAFAITQGTSCWCSNYVPDQSRQVEKNRCDQPCPAFPSENCGGRGVYGYLVLNNKLPSGTSGGPESTSSSSEAVVLTATMWVTKTVQDTASTSRPPSSSSSSATTSSTTSSSSSSSSTESQAATTPPSSSLVQTVTAGGTVKTVTIVPTQATQATQATNQIKSGSRSSGGGLETGGVVGIVVGVIAGVLAIAGLSLFFYFRHKKQNQDESSIRGSLSGMIGGRPDMSAAPGSPGSTGNRSSTLQIDPRMDPFKQGLYARSGSHESVNTLRDDHDYSRRIQQPKVLRATNPDPVDD